MTSAIAPSSLTCAMPALLDDRPRPLLFAERFREHVLRLLARDRSRGHQADELGDHLGRQHRGRQSGLVDVRQHFLAHPVDDLLRRAAAAVGSQGRDRALRVLREPRHLDQDPRVLRTDPPLLHVTRALRGRKLRHRRAHAIAHLLRRLDRDEIGFGEVAVVVGLFLRAARDRATLLFVPVARLLHDLLTRLCQRPLTFGFVVDRTQQRPQRVEVLDLRPRPELGRSRYAYRDVRVDAQ